MNYDVSPRRLVFRSPPWLEARDLALFAMGWILLLALIRRTADPATDDGIALAGVFVLGLVGIVFLPSSHVVVVDGDAGLVHDQLRWLRWGPSRASLLRDFEAVVLQRTSRDRSEATGAPGSTVNPIRRWTEHGFVLRLLRPQPFHAIDLPLPRGMALGTMHALALELAACGGWPAWRQGWRPQAGGDTDAWDRLSFDVREPLT
jgi:hypothetical protein